MNQPFGFSRDIITPRYALFTPGGFVPSTVPGWTNCTVNIVIAPALGADFVQSIVNLQKSGRGIGRTQKNELFLYVLDGRCTLSAGKDRRSMAPGSYAYIPPESDYDLKSDKTGTRLLIFEKRFEPLAGQTAPEALFGDAGQVQALPFLGNPKALLQTLLPETLAFDLAVNIFVYQPGAALPFVETHLMEHGLLMLAGAGIYRLDAGWHPVQDGDVIWMAPYCPQWFAAVGDEPASYIYYKNVNRQPQLS